MANIKSTIQQNIDCVMMRIERAASSVGRSANSVRMVVVTKGHPLEVVREVVETGIHDFGENYVQEGLDKIQALSDYPGLTWHMIGHVQSRKAEDVCASFDWLHSLDSLKLAQRLEQSASQRGRVLPVLLECNVSGEETKFGFPAWQKENWPALLGDISKILSFNHIQVHGLMTMAPFFQSPEPARPYFARLVNLRNFLSAQFPQASWNELSMGMSGDFDVAIEEGATIVRIGTAIIGPRPA